MKIPFMKPLKRIENVQEQFKIVTSANIIIYFNEIVQCLLYLQ